MESENECCECEFCGSILSEKKVLVKHQKTAKKCLKIQKNPTLLKNIIKELKPKVLIQNPKIEELKEIIDNLKKEFQEWKENAGIKTRNDNSSNISTINGISVNRGNNNGNNNNINNINNILVFSPNLSRENIQEICNDEITPEILMEEYGLAELYVNTIAKNKEGKYGMVNTNKRVPVLHYRNEKGEIKKDQGALELTKNFRECSIVPINKQLKMVKKKVGDLTDYSVIEENVKDDKKLIKDIADKLHIDNVNNELMKLEQRKRSLESKDQKIIENNEIKILEDKFQEVKDRMLFSCDIKVNLNKLRFEDVNKEEEYKDTEEHEMWVIIDNKKVKIKSTYKKQREDFIDNEKIKIREQFEYQRNKELRDIKEKIKILNVKWFSKKREKEQRKEEIRNQKKIKKELKETRKKGEVETMTE